MTFDEIDKMTKNNCVLPFSRKDLGYRMKREAYDNREVEIKEIFKKTVFKELGIEKHKKRDVLWRMAWDRGHASGYCEVYQCCLDLVELIK